MALTKIVQNTWAVQFNGANAQELLDLAHQYDPDGNWSLLSVENGTATYEHTNPFGATYPESIDTNGWLVFVPYAPHWNGQVLTAEDFERQYRLEGE